MKNQKVESLVIFKCNCRCLMCSTGLQIDRSIGNDDYCAIKSFESVKNDIDKAFRQKASGFAFSGGEPTLRKDLPDLVKYAKSRGIKHIEVQSNGRIYANKYYGKKLIEAGVNNFVVSFHSHLPKINDKIMGVPGSFSQQFEGVKNLNSLKQKVKINIVLTKLNYSSLEEHVHFLMKNFQIAEFRFSFVLLEGHAKKNGKSIVAPMSLVAPHVGRAIKLAHSKVKCFIYNMVPCLLSGSEKYINDMGNFNTLLLGPDFETSLDKAKKNDKIKPLQCQDCKHNHWCNGIWKAYGELFGFDEIKAVK